MSKFLFIGGPEHGKELDVPADRWEYLIPTSEEGTIMYIRWRMADRGAERIRSVFAPRDMHLYEAERRLTDHLLSAWVNAAPDERKAE